MKTSKLIKIGVILVATLTLIAMVDNLALAAPPIAVDDTATAVMSTTLNIDVRANDSDPDSGDTFIVESVVNRPSYGTATINTNGTINYYATANSTGQDSFTYRLRDSQGEFSNIATVNITVHSKLTLIYRSTLCSTTVAPEPLSSSLINSDGIYTYTYTYTAGTNVALEAVNIHQDFIFVWTGDIRSIDNPLTITLDKNKSLIVTLINTVPVEDLNEIFLRKGRKRTATWGPQYLENPTTFIWQPETLMYKDVSTGHECWKMSDTPQLKTCYYKDIGMSTWSADGDKVSFRTIYRGSQAYKQSTLNNKDWGKYLGYTMNTTGSAIRPIVEAAALGGSFIWSPQEPGVYYERGSLYNQFFMGGLATTVTLADEHTIYKQIVDQDGMITRTGILTVPDNAIGVIEKMFSADGKKAIIYQYHNGSTLPDGSINASILTPITIWPNDQARVDVPNGYSVDRDFAAYGEIPVDPETGRVMPVANYHDRYYAGLGDWYFALCSGSSTWWKIKTVGSAPDGGALSDNSDFPVDDRNYDFGEVWPENSGGPVANVKISNIRGIFQNGEYLKFTPSGAYGWCRAWDVNKPTVMTITIREIFPYCQFGDTITGQSSGATATLSSTAQHMNARIPWVHTSSYNPEKTTYWSHFTPDRWGRYALFTNCADSLPGSFENGVIQNTGSGIWDITNHRWVVPTFGNGAQHHDWHGFTDWSVSSTGRGSYPDAKVSSQKYNDPNSQIVVCSAHTRYDGGYDYDTLARPGQSPDGTKVAWHSEFLNGFNGTDMFWSVVMYPFPPTNLTASSSNGIKISFLPPKYTERRWIDPATGKLDEVNGEELYAREIKQYHLWRSTNQTGGWQEIGVIPAEYANDQVTNTLKPKANGNWVNSSNKISYTDHPQDGTYYYALTSEEHSNLESDELSEILQVTVSGGQVASQTIVAAKGQKDFWRTLPQRPSNFTYQPTGVQGHYRLNWTEPNDSKLRYYNIYYSTVSNPTAIQQQRIASLPKGQTTYLDWLADPSNQGYYAITSVDRYGNESPIRYTSTHITASNIDTSNQTDELLIDFGTNGIWTYSTTTNTWNTLHYLGSESIISVNLDSNPTEDLVIDFGNYGIWIYSNNSTWINLHNISPESITKADLDSNPTDDLVIDYGDYGIWIYLNNNTWVNLHTLNSDTITSAKLDSDTIDELVIDFGNEGIWVYYPSSKTWAKLHNLNPDSIISANIDSNPLDDLIIDFGTNGIWIYLNNSTWVKLHTLNPDSITRANIDSDTKDDLIIDFGTNGIWVYPDNLIWIWIKIHSLSPESITRANLDSDPKDDLVIDFGTNGIWVYYNNNTWVKIHE